METSAHKKSTQITPVAKVKCFYKTIYVLFKPGNGSDSVRLVVCCYRSQCRKLASDIVKQKCGMCELHIELKIHSLKGHCNLNS